MKKIGMITLLIVIITIMAMGGLIFWDSKQYFKEYFESQRKELNLRSEKSVDSLVNVIIDKNKAIDSLKVVNTGLNEKNTILITNVKSLTKTNDWLRSCLAW